MIKTLIIVEHEEIFVSSKRDIDKKIISYKDKKELFSIIHTDRFNQKKYVFSRKGSDGIKSNSIVGSISLKSGLIIEILPKFAKDDLTDETIIKYRKNLLRMIHVSNEKNFISSTLQSSKISVGEMPLIRYMIELFSESLLHSLRNSVVTTYNRTVENSSYVRGNILLTKTLQNNIVDKSKVYISYNKHSSNNLLMQIFKTLSQLLLNDTNLSYRAKQYLYEVYILLDSVTTISLKQHHFEKVVFNRLNDKYETLFKQAEFIFNQYMPFTSNINSTPFWAILFNMDYLFEKFCAYLLRRSQIEVLEQEKIPAFNNNNSLVSAKPDFIIKEQVDLFHQKSTNVLDAKWKLLDSEKKLYGLNAQNFWQLFSYMNLIEDEEINGYFIVPKNSDNFDDEVVFEPIRQGRKSITILSIDFSLEFDEILERYQFKLKNGCLKIDLKEKKEQEVVEVTEEEKDEIVLEDIVPIVIEEESDFDFEQFIYELMLLHTLGKKRNKIHHNKEDKRFKNLFYLKKKQKVNKEAFRVLKDNNIAISELSWHLENLDIKEVPEDIKYLKNLKYLKIINENLTLTKSLLELNNLTNLIVNKSIVLNNIEILKELKDKGIKIEDNEGNDLFEENILVKKPEKKEKKLENKEQIENIKPTANNSQLTKEEEKISITLEDYSTINYDDKIDFCIQSNFKLVDKDVIKKLCYEKNKDILTEIIYNRTIDIRFILLVYILNFKDWKFKEEYLFRVVKEINNKNLTYIIKLSENSTTYDVAKYIETNFLKIDNEILFGYAISNIDSMGRMREMISKNTNDLDILNELSKNKDDKNIIGNIIFKGKNNKIFRDKVNRGDTIYSKKTLDRIAKYEQYYRYEDDKCYVAQVAGNYALIKETREYLFYKYKDDKIVLKKLDNNSLYYCHHELKNKIEDELNVFNINNNNIEKENNSYGSFNSINFESTKFKKE